ncbi:MAG: SPOR domain-containing protein [Alphaproteobacteria bacterium]|nr:MAG: SPOR domain-containing protein [Alphaproteobacteria bacterium]
MSDERDKGPLPDKDTPPWLQPVPEEEEAEGFFDGRKKLVIGGALCLTVVVLFVAVMLSLYKGGDDGPARHITAAEGPYRERPDEPGGMEVPHQDKQVFEQADGGAVRESVQLGDQPEEPLESLPEEEDVATDVADTDVEQPKMETVPVPEPKPEPAKPEPKKAEVKTEAAPATTTTDSGYRAQLGAYGSEDGAAKAWRTIRGKYPELVTGLSPSYEAVRSGDRTLYRLRVGPFENRAAADAACLGLRARQQACIVVNP